MDLKMISNDLRSSCRALLIGAYQDGGGGGNSGEWIYPESWLPLPEPDYRGMNLIIVTQNPISSQDSAAFIVHSDNGGVTGADMEIDWGDGTIEKTSVILSGYVPVSHTYTQGTGHKVGDCEQYLVKFRFLNYENFAAVMPYIERVGGMILAVKVGNGLRVYASALINGSVSMCKYIKCGDLSLEIARYPNQNVERFEYAGSPITEIPDRFLSGWNVITDENLIGIDFSKITSFGVQAFSSCYSLFKHGVKAPNCTYVGRDAFSCDYCLNSVQFAENCTFGDGALYGCYSLYDNPAYKKTQS